MKRRSFLGRTLAIVGGLVWPYKPQPSTYTNQWSYREDVYSGDCRVAFVSENQTELQNVPNGYAMSNRRRYSSQPIGQLEYRLHVFEWNNKRGDT